MEIVYFVGALILLTALIYASMHWHYRDRRQARRTDQIVPRPVRAQPNLIEAIMPKEPITGREPDFSGEDIQREQFGPRGVPEKDDPATTTPSAKRSSRYRQQGDPLRSSQVQRSRLAIGRTGPLGGHARYPRRPNEPEACEVTTSRLQLFSSNSFFSECLSLSVVLYFCPEV
jgi:hypothetical protein